MAQEAVQIIKRAEEEAKNIIISAEKEALNIVETAERNSTISKNQLVEKLKDDYFKAVEKAKNDADNISKENLLKIAEKNNELQKKLIKNKEKAIEKVLKKVLEG